MPSVVTSHETKTVRTTRAAEARATDELMQGGWEVVERKERFLGRIELVARRQKRATPMWVWVGGGGIAAALLVGVIIGASIPSGSTAAADATTVAVASSAPVTMSASPAESPTTSATAASTDPAEDATAAPVTHGEVVAAFKHYFRERAAANVMVGKAVTKVSFSHGVVKVVFDPAAAGVTEARFDATKGFDNLAKFASTPVAFADETGNRLRPVIDEIKAVDVDGASLGSFDRADILAQNELSK